MKQLNAIFNYRKWKLLILLMVMANGYNTIYAQQLITVSATSTASCSDNGSITLSISGGDAPYDITLRAINSIDSISIKGTNTTLNTINNLRNSYYSIYVKDNSGNQGYTSIKVNAQFDVTTSTTPESCSLDGSMTANPSGGAAPYTYLWSNGATTQSVTNVATGIYSLLVTDANGCKFHEEDTIYVSELQTLKLETSSTPMACLALGAASVTAHAGLAPYTYYWSTTPVQTSSAVSNLTPGNYTVKVTDANGCSDQAWVYIYDAGNSLSLSTSNTDELCSKANGTATVYSNGTAPFTYTWSNGQTTKTAVNLERGWYDVKVQDANACSATTSVFVSDSATLAISFTKTVPECGAANGLISAIVTGGHQPYSYSWNNGQTTQSISGLYSGGYSVKVTDAEGCIIKGWEDISNTSKCYAFISGYVYNEINGNCTRDIGENGIAGAIINLSNGWSTISGVNGYYAFWVTPGTYTLTQTPPSYYTQKCPLSPSSITVNASTAGGSYYNNIFANEVIREVTDLAVEVYCGAPRPGFTRNNTVAYWNNGTVATSGTIEYTFSGPWEYAYAYPAASSYDPITKKATWNLSSIAAGENGYIYVYMSVAPTVEVGVQVSCGVNISSVALDNVSYNNNGVCSTLTVGSYDPNDIQVFPKGEGSEGYISSEDTLLTYLIRFQNTGSDTAYTVVVRDTIDTYLTKDSIRSVISSHPCEVSIIGNILEFTFEDIDLLDSTFNEKASHGFVSYKIKRKKSLLPGTEIKNKSDIYFDYNAPVATNKVRSTIALETSLKGESSNDNMVNVFPVPFNEQINLTFNKEVSGHVIIKLIGMNGEDLGVVNDSYVTSGQNELALNLSQYDLKPGIYILKVMENEKVYHKKIVKTNN